MGNATMFRCVRCRALKPLRTHHDQPNYGRPSVRSSRKVCPTCCAGMLREFMRARGRAKLYLAKEHNGSWSVCDFLGELRFPVTRMVDHTRNAFGRRAVSPRVDVWFNGPDGRVWQAYQKGDDNTVAHCRRTRRTVPCAAW